MKIYNYINLERNYIIWLHDIQNKLCFCLFYRPTPKINKIEGTMKIFVAPQENIDTCYIPIIIITSTCSTINYQRREIGIVSLSISVIS